MTPKRWILILLLFAILAGCWGLAIIFPDVRWFAETVTAVALLLVTVPAVAPSALAWVHSAQVAAGSDARRFRAQLRKAFAALDRIHKAGGSGRVPLYVALVTNYSEAVAVFEHWGFTRIPPASTTGGNHSAHVGSLRCDIWHSDEAVVVAPWEEGNGRMDETWTTVLAQLRRRRDRPLEAAFLLPNVGDLLSEQNVLLALAERFAAQLEQAVAELGRSFATYILWTGAAQIAGFSVFWSDLATPDDVAWGAAFALDDDTVVRDPARVTEREFSLLADALRARVVKRLASERDASRRSLVLRFPLEFQKLGAPLAAFVRTLFHERPKVMPALRGIYVANAPSAVDHGPAHFLGDVLRSIILPDRNLYDATARAGGNGLWRGAFASLCAVALSFMALVPALRSYSANGELIEQARGLVRLLRDDGSGEMPGTQSDASEAALDLLSQCDSEASGPLIPGWFGPVAARALRGPLRRAYVERLHSWLSRRVRTELERRIDGIAYGPGLADSPKSVNDMTPLRQAYEFVRLDTLLADRGRHVPDASAADQLASLWRSTVPASKAVTLERFRDHSARYLAAAAGLPDLAWPYARSLASARQRLKALDVEGIPLRRLLLGARDTPAVRASSNFGATTLQFLQSRGDTQVPGAYTRAGWVRIRDILERPESWPPSASLDAWALGDDEPSPSDERSRREHVLHSYFDDFVRHWMTFLDELRVTAPRDVATARTELSALKGPEGFYSTLFGLVRQNALPVEHEAAPVQSLVQRLPWPQSNLDAGAPSADELSPVQMGLRPILLFAGSDGDAAADKRASAPLAKYLSMLDGLSAALDAQSSGTAASAAPSTANPFAAAISGLKELLDGIDEPMHERLWHLLAPPVLGSAVAAKAGNTDTIASDWKTKVWTAWDDKLANRFPFAVSNQAEAVAFADFASFFRPDGILSTFVRTNLADRVEVDGHGRVRPKDGAEPLSPDLLEFLTNAAEVTDAFFGADTEPGLRFSIQADWEQADVASAQFFVGAKGTALPRGQWTEPVRWSGEDVHIQWLQAGRPTEQFGRHSFSLFDFFSGLGGLKPGAGRSSYVADCAPLHLKIRAEGTVDALRASFFSRLRCPQDIRVR